MADIFLTAAAALLLLLLPCCRVLERGNARLFEREREIVENGFAKDWKLVFFFSPSPRQSQVCLETKAIKPQLAVYVCICDSRISRFPRLGCLFVRSFHCHMPKRIPPTAFLKLPPSLQSIPFPNGDSFLKKTQCTRSLPGFLFEPFKSLRL